MWFHNLGLLCKTLKSPCRNQAVTVVTSRGNYHDTLSLKNSPWSGVPARSLSSLVFQVKNPTSPQHRFMQRAVFPSSGRVFAFQDGGFCRYPSTGRRRQTGRPNARPRTGCITRRTYFLRIIFKVLRLVYYCASVGADFYSFSYRTSCDLVARDQNLSPLAQPGFWRWLPAGRNRPCLHSCSIVCLVIVPIPINRWPSGNGSSSRRQVFD